MSTNSNAIPTKSTKFHKFTLNNNVDKLERNSYQIILYTSTYL
jgi:hypothetical protein